jgi:hypothetical protein
MERGVDAGYDDRAADRTRRLRGEDRRMSDLVGLALGPLYGLAWLGVAHSAVQITRLYRRDRTSRAYALRLWRWRHC